MPEISQELDELSCNLIGMAIDILEAKGEVPLLLAVDGDDEAYAFDDDTPDGCYRAACEQIAELGPACNRYAMAYEGVVQEDELDSGEPAILFEFAERDAGPAWSGYMLYRRRDDGLLEVTEPLPAGEEEPLFG